MTVMIQVIQMMLLSSGSALHSTSLVGELWPSTTGEQAFQDMLLVLKLETKCQTHISQIKSCQSCACVSLTAYDRYPTYSLVEDAETLIKSLSLHTFTLQMNIEAEQF